MRHSANQPIPLSPQVAEYPAEVRAKPLPSLPRRLVRPLHIQVTQVWAIPPETATRRCSEAGRSVDGTHLEAPDNQRRALRPTVWDWRIPTSRAIRVDVGPVPRKYPILHCAPLNLSCSAIRASLHRRLIVGVETPSTEADCSTLNPWYHLKSKTARSSSGSRPACSCSSVNSARSCGSSTVGDAPSGDEPDALA